MFARLRWKLDSDGVENCVVDCAKGEEFWQVDAVGSTPKGYADVYFVNGRQLSDDEVCGYCYLMED